MSRTRALALTLAAAAVTVAALPTAGASASPPKHCGTVTPIRPRGSGGGIPSRLTTRVARGSVECSTTREIFQRYYVTGLTGPARIEHGFRCTGGVEPRALIVCKRGSSVLEAEKA